MVDDPVHSARSIEDLAEGARKRRATPRTERRELATESIAATTFLVLAAVLFAAFDGASAELGVAALLCAVGAVLVGIEFEVGEGGTRPLQLVLPAMLVLLPAGAVPLVLGAAFVLPRAALALARRGPAHRIVSSCADALFCLAPVLVVGLLGLPGDVTAGVLVVTAATAGQFALDFLAGALRVRLGPGLPVRVLYAPFAWVWLVDLLLLPTGLAAAALADGRPLLVLAVLPLAGLLAVFARERRGRIDNAVALQHAAQAGKARLQSIVRNASDLIAIVTPSGHLETLIGAVDPVFGADPSAAEGSALADHVHPDDAAGVAAWLAAAAAKPLAHSLEAEWRLRHDDGTFHHVSAVATNLLEDPDVAGLVLIARDVDARKAFEAQLRHRAFHDPLTSLANRALFYDRVEHAIARGEREGRPVAVLYLDLDDFKAVNDRAGHAAGDELLIAVAGRLGSALRSGDTPARLGGDEFGILLESVNGPNEAVTTAERLLATLAEPYDVGGDRVTVSASVGIALSDGLEAEVEELLRRADVAMYAAKANGKRRLELFAPALDVADPRSGEGRPMWFQTAAAQREEVVSMLEDEHALTMVFQPLVDLRTGRVAGYESLARFNDALGRPPNAWFAQAHRVGLGYELEAKALAAALAHRDRPAGTFLTVNISPSALLSETVAQILPERLDGIVVEITENEAIADDPEVAAVLAAIRSRGALLAVDDTGSGYAGLHHIMRLSPDVIKLDRSMVAGVAHDPVKGALIESFVRYAREIDAVVCAEGIEEMDDLARLADLDVALGQGYGLARPGAPWAAPAPEAVAACRTSFDRTLAGTPDGQTEQGTTDGRLELLTELLAQAREVADVERALSTVAGELHADAIRLVTPTATHAWPAALTGTAGTWTVPSVRQSLVGDGRAALLERQAVAALGYRSRLQIPIRSRGRTLGTLEALALEERPWSRFEIRRARIAAAGLGAALAHLEADELPPASLLPG